MIKHGMIVGILLLACFSVFAQNKFNLQVGGSLQTFADEIDSYPGERHTAQHIGFDVVVGETKFMFIPGFHYYRTSLLRSTEGFSGVFDRKESYHFVKMPIAFGYRLIKLPMISAGIYAGPGFNFFVDVDENDFGIRSDRFKGVSATAVIGVKVLALKHISLDVNFDKAFSPTFNDRPDSRLRGWNFSIGVAF